MSEASFPTTGLHPAINALLANLRTGDPKIHNGLGLWPLFADSRPEPAYFTLVEALSHDGFKITEVSEGGSVPSLRVVNETRQNVLLFDGEELKGAKQNRILNTTILIAAGTSLDVPVSCTEQGRWSYDMPQFSSSGSLAHSELRKRKSIDVAMSLEQSQAHFSNQSAVWEEIESLHLAAKTSGSSKTRAMKDAYNERQKELDDFTREVVCNDGQRGLLAVIGDRVEGMDLLSRPEAYATLHRRLVESHAMDFLVRKQGKSRKPLDPAAPARFLAEAAKAHESQHDTPGLGRDHRLRFRWGHGAALRVDDTIVHLALFGGGGLGQGHPPTEPRLRRRHRDWI
jgi:flavodoxin